MPPVARLKSGVRIEQYYKDHHPPHFHAIYQGDEALYQGDEALYQGDEALIEIAWPMSIYAGSLSPRAMSEVLQWARKHRAELALNWVDALAQQAVRRIA